MLSSPFAFYSLIVLWITQIKYEVAKALSRMDITIYTKHQQSCYHSYESMKCGRLDLCLHSLENPDVVLRLPDFPQLYLIWQMRFKSPGVGGQDQASLPACLSAGVFVHTYMTFEITQLWRQIACSSLWEPKHSSLTQMFTFELLTLLSVLLFLSTLTTLKKKSIFLKVPA